MSGAPRVAAIHDLSGLGRCSLSVILPVLSVMGAQCCPLPTAVLSAHTAFPALDKLSFRDLSGEMARTMDHWAALEMDFKAVYSGFLGSEAQLDLTGRFLDTFRRADTLVLVDPVMGDHGKVYRTYTPVMCRRMADLADRADLITPNLTEAALLLDEPWEKVPTDRAGVEDWLRRLSRNGSRSVVLTGVSTEPGAVGAASLDRADGSVSFALVRREPGSFSGTGDLFAAVLLGALLRGKSLARAAEQAVDFVRLCIAHTLALGTPVLDGVQFEDLLGNLL